MVTTNAVGFLTTTELPSSNDTTDTQEVFTTPYLKPVSELSTVALAILLVIIIFGVLLNALLIAFILRHRVLRKSAAYSLAILGSVQVLHCLLLIPPAFAQHFLVFPTALCIVIRIVETLLKALSLAILTMAFYDGHVALTEPIKFKKALRLKRIIPRLGVTVSFSIMLVVPMGIYIALNGASQCNLLGIQNLSTLSGGLGVLAPLLFSIILYCITLTDVRKQTKEVKQLFQNNLSFKKGRYKTQPILYQSFSEISHNSMDIVTTTSTVSETSLSWQNGTENENGPKLTNYSSDVNKNVEADKNASQTIIDLDKTPSIRSESNEKKHIHMTLPDSKENKEKATNTSDKTDEFEADCPDSTVVSSKEQPNTLTNPQKDSSVEAVEDGSHQHPVIAKDIKIEVFEQLDAKSSSLSLKEADAGTTGIPNEAFEDLMETRSNERIDTPSASLPESLANDSVAPNDNLASEATDSAENVSEINFGFENLKPSYSPMFIRSRKLSDDSEDTLPTHTTIRADIHTTENGEKVDSSTVSADRSKDEKQESNGLTKWKSTDNVTHLDEITVDVDEKKQLLKQLETRPNGVDNRAYSGQDCLTVDGETVQTRRKRSILRNPSEEHTHGRRVSFASGVKQPSNSGRASRKRRRSRQGSFSNKRRHSTQQHSDDSLDSDSDPDLRRDNDGTQDNNIQSAQQYHCIKLADRLHQTNNYITAILLTLITWMVMHLPYTIARLIDDICAQQCAVGVSIETQVILQWIARTSPLPMAIVPVLSCAELRKFLNSVVCNWSK